MKKFPFVFSRNLQYTPPPLYPLPPSRAQAAEADAAATTLRARLDASTLEAETLATELHESEEAVAARDDLLRKAGEAAESSKERLIRVLGEGEAAARRAGEAEALAAAEAGREGSRVLIRFSVSSLLFMLVWEVQLLACCSLMHTRSLLVVSCRAARIVASVL